MARNLSPNEFLSSLKEIMLGLDRKTSALLAAGVTDWVNRKMARQDEAGCPSGIDEILWSICCCHLQKVDANLNSLNLGWQAYRKIYLPETQNLKTEIQFPQLVSSLPSELRQKMKLSIEETGIWEGSVLENIAEMISDAKKLIQIINPYWSDYGISPILKRLNLGNNLQVQALILTRKGLETSEQIALENLCKHFESHGINSVVKYLDCSNDRGGEALLHAKAIVVDQSKAYLGSANFTGNGMSQSVELGIVFEGFIAEKLSNWISALGSHMTTFGNFPSG